MSFKRLFSTTLSQTAASTDFTVNFGDTSLSATLPGVISTSSLSAEAPAVVKYVRYKIGEPVLTVHMDNRQIFLAFEEANLKFSSIINAFQARSWMIQYYGLSNDFTTQDFTNKLPGNYANFIKKLTENIAWEMSSPIGGNVLNNIRKGYIELEVGEQDYDIYNKLIDNTTKAPLSATITALTGSINSTKIDLKTIYHYPAVTLYRFYDPYSSVNMLSQEFNFESFNVESIFYVLPIWTDILRAMQLNMNDKVRRSNYSYERVGRRFRVFPVPTSPIKLWIDYTTTQQDPFNPEDTESVSGISNFTQIPFTDLAYSKINAPGKMWIRDYTYAICLEIEGRIRRKFDKVPIPGDSVVLDGAQLVSEGISKQIELEKQLREDLEKLTVQNVMKENAELKSYMEAELKQYPLYIYMY